VPYNPYNLRDKKYGSAKVAAAGPGANLLVALVFGLCLRFMPFLPISLVEIFSLIVILNILLGVFNLIPIPPLDGSKILFTFLPYSLRNIRIFLERFGLIVLLFVIFFALKWLIPVVFLIFYLIVGKGISF
jgi:Zn-dependent protease